MSKFEKSIQKMRCKMAQVSQHVEEKEHEIGKLLGIIERMKRSSTNDLDKKSSQKVDHHAGWFKDQVSKVLKRRSKKDYLPLIENVIESSIGNHMKKSVNLEEKPERVCISAPSTPKFMMKNRINLGDYSDNVYVLREKLAEKDRQITEMKLELLSTENQMIDLEDSKTPLEKKLLSMREENKLLQSLASNGLNFEISRASSSGSMNEMKESLYGYSKKVVLVLEGWTLSCFSILTTTTWTELDEVVKSKFSDYLLLLDAKQTLGLSEDDLKSYHVGREKIERSLGGPKDDSMNLVSPEMLPYGYLVEDNSVCLCLKTLLDYLVFETGISKTVLSKIILLAQKEKKLLFVAQHGTGKSYLVRKLANYLVKNSRNNCSDVDDVSSSQSAADYVYFLNFAANIEETLRPIVNDLSVRCQEEKNLVVLILKNVHILPKLEQFFRLLNQAAIVKL